MADHELISPLYCADHTFAVRFSSTQSATVTSTNDTHHTTFMLDYKFLNFFAYCFTTRDITASVEV